MRNKKEICVEFNEIVRLCGGELKFGNVEDSVKLELGDLLVEYMVGSIYDCDWEGFSSSELGGIRSLMFDMKLNKESGLI